VHVALQAAALLSQAGIEVEVIDLRTLWPWDKSTVLESVARTRRLLVAHEAVSVAGFGAEIVATVCENLHGSLLAAPARVAAPRIHIGYAPSLEEQVRVTPKRLVDAATRLMQPTMEEIR
jgi:pyruvate dehydrogenase E1 component beta subunit